jgi:hypothetical protein
MTDEQVADTRRKVAEAQAALQKNLHPLHEKLYRDMGAALQAQLDEEDRNRATG